jgi:hypothetical protein
MISQKQRQKQLLREFRSPERIPKKCSCLTHRIHGAGIYANIKGMGSMLPYIPYIDPMGNHAHVCR